MIARDTSAVIANWTASTSTSITYTCTGTDRYLQVSIFAGSPIATMTASYNSTSMTLLGGSPVTDADGNKNWVFYLANPSSGSNTLTVTSSGGSNWSGVAASYTGVDQTTPIDSYVTDAGIASVASSFTTSSITVGSADNWLVQSFRDQTKVSITSSTVSKVNGTVTVEEEIWDSNGSVSSGSQTVTLNLSPDGKIMGSTLISLAGVGGGGGGGGSAFSQCVIIS